MKGTSLVLKPNFLSLTKSLPLLCTLRGNKKVPSKKAELATRASKGPHATLFQRSSLALSPSHIFVLSESRLVFGASIYDVHTREGEEVMEKETK